VSWETIPQAFASAGKQQAKKNFNIVNSRGLCTAESKTPTEIHVSQIGVINGG